MSEQPQETTQAEEPKEESKAAKIAKRSTGYATTQLENRAESAIQQIVNKLLRSLGL